MKNSSTISEQAIEEVVAGVAAIGAALFFNSIYYGVKGSHHIMRAVRRRYKWKKSECRDLKNLLETLYCVKWYTRKELDDLKRELRKCGDSRCQDEVRDRIAFLKKNLNLYNQRIDEEKRY